MQFLYNGHHTKRDTYCYEINSGGAFLIKESGKVTITFENDVFVSCDFPLRGVYSRNGWRILAGINETITRIENKKEAEKQ